MVAYYVRTAEPFKQMVKGRVNIDTEREETETDARTRRLHPPPTPTINGENQTILKFSLNYPLNFLHESKNTLI